MELAISLSLVVTWLVITTRDLIGPLLVHTHWIATGMARMLVVSLALTLLYLRVSLRMPLSECIEPLDVQEGLQMISLWLPLLLLMILAVDIFILSYLIHELVHF